MNNFKEILEKYTVQIPIIQRDYAQGRMEPKVNEIRAEFLKTFFYHLSEKESLHLDFVYGSIKDIGQKKVFIPLDGQQRLTTLFLLHLYFGKKEDKDITYLENFTYETRASSREFCKKLVSSNVDFSENNLSKNIKDAHWFLAFWEKDPTIQSMLTMLNSIHTQFFEYKFYDDLSLITFEFFELEKFGLDDDLYIKMNARGKALTEFENFKAKFENFLESKDKKIKDEFAQKIDSTWTDSFWSYKDKKYLIDSSFMNYFYFISEMLYYKTYSEVLKENIIEHFEIIKLIYQDSSNIDFLFKSLDNLKNISDAVKDLFVSYEYKSTKVAIFDKNINFLDRVIKKDNLNLQNMVLLFIVIGYLKDNSIDNNLRELVRVARNLLERIRSLKQGRLIYTATMEYKNLHYIINLFFSQFSSNIYNQMMSNNFDLSNTDITKKSFLQEKKKAELFNKDLNFKELVFKLEDYKYLKGDIHNFLIDDIDTLQFYATELPNIYNNDNESLIIRSMLCIDDYSLSRGWAAGNRKYFFGKQGYWEIILTMDNVEESINYKKFFDNYFNKYKAYNNSMDKMVEVYTEESDRHDWRYYFIKYKEMIELENKLTRDNNVFAWYEEEGFNIEKMGGSNLNAFHLNPYLRTVAIKSKIPYSVYKWDGYSYLNIRGKLSEFCINKNGWQVKFSDTFSQNEISILVKTFNLEQKLNNLYELNEFEDKDRIMIAVEFINAVLKIN